jgi:type IV secretion system protein VirB2
MLRLVRSYIPCLVAIALMAVAVMIPELAHASDTGDGALPFETPLKTLTKSLQGPVAFGISLIGIIAAGAVLIFGGEMSGFLRTMVFLVLVIAIIVNAGGVIKMISSEAAEIATLIDAHAERFLVTVRGLG